MVVVIYNESSEFMAWELQAQRRNLEGSEELPKSVEHMKILSQQKVRF